MTGAATSRVRTRPPRGRVGAYRCTRVPEEIEPFLDDAAHVPGGHAPEVCFPTNEAEVAAILAAGTPVLPVGAQSSLTGGATPRGETVLSTARLAAIARFDGDTVTVGPGVVLRTLLAALAPRDRYYPPVPTYDGASVGGTVATNAAGAATFKYGTTRAWVRGLTVVLASGEVLDLRRGEVTADAADGFTLIAGDGRERRLPRPRIRMPAVPKQSAGYFSAPGMDLLDLFIGAEGTLGVVTEVVLGLIAPRPTWLSCLAFPADEPAALALVDALRAASLATRAARDPRGLDVAAIEYLDARSLAILREDGAGRRVGIALPPAARVAVFLDAELAPGTTGEAAAAELAAATDATHVSPPAALGRLLARHGVLETAVPALPGDERRRAALVALREAVPEGVNRRIRTAQREVDPSITKAACDVIVPFARFAESLATYRRILAAHGLDHAIWGHASDGNVHPNAMPRSGEEMRRAEAAVLALGEAAIALGGCPMSEHGTGRSAVKQALLARLYGADGVASMQAVKAVLDPCGLLAPGVLFPPARTVPSATEPAIRNPRS